MHGLKRARQERTLSAIFSVEVHGVACAELRHELGDVASSPFTNQEVKPLGHQTMADDIDKWLPSFDGREAVIVGTDTTRRFHANRFAIITTVKQKRKTKIITMANKNFLFSLTLIIDMVELLGVKYGCSIHA